MAQQIIWGCVNSDGTTYSGPFFQVTRETTVDSLGPLSALAAPEMANDPRRTKRF